MALKKVSGPISHRINHYEEEKIRGEQLREHAQTGWEIFQRAIPQTESVVG